MLLSDLSVKRPVLASVMSLLLVAFGLVAFWQLDVREYPDIDPPVVTVQTDYRGASASVVETRITQLVEERVAEVEAVRTITSSSQDGRSRVTVEFQTSRNLDAAAGDVREAIARVRATLPDEAEEPEITKEGAGEDAPIVFNLNSTWMDAVELADYAERYLVDRFTQLSGVARVRIAGGSRYAMRLWLDREALAARELTPGDIEDALRRENVEVPAGAIESNDRQLTARLERTYRTEDDFRRLVIRRGADGHLTRLGEVARVELGAELPRLSFRGNREDQVGLLVVKQSQANTLEVSRQARAEAERVRASLPEHLTLNQSRDDSVFVEAALGEVFKTLGIAVLLVIFVVYLFLGSWRATLVPAVTVPVSLVGTGIVLYALGFSINTFTLLALVMAIGLVVDDAIVVLENVYRRIEAGETPLVAAYRGAREVGFAVVATTLVLVAVFAPIAFLSGDLGRLFGEFAVTMTAAVIFSSFTALTLSVALSSKVLRVCPEKNGPSDDVASAKESGPAERNRLQRAADRTFAALERRYRSALSRAVRRPWLAVSVLAAAFAGAWGLYQLVPSELAPRQDRGTFDVFVSGPEGASFTYMTEFMDEVEEHMMHFHDETGEALRVLSLTPNAFGSTQTYSSGRGIIVLEDHDARRSAFVIMDSLRSRLADLHGVRAFVVMRQGLGGAEKPVQFVIGGPTYEALAGWRDLILQRARENPGLVGVDHDYKETRPQLRIRVDETRAAELGVSATEIGRTLETLLGSRQVTTFPMRGEEYDVLLEADYGEVRAPQDLAGVYVRSERSGRLIPLSNLVRTDEFADAGALNRYNRMRAVTIEANLADGYSLGEALAFLEGAAREELPPEAVVDYRGESLDYQEAGRSVAFVFLLALAVVFLVLAAQFESFVHPVTLILTVPLAAAGGLLGLLLFDQTLNIYSQVALIVLIGLGTKNGILIAEFIGQLREQGMAFDEAVVEGAVRRLRPVLMTALTTVMGALPLLLSSGPGYETRFVVGVVVVFGTAVSACLTLFTVPTTYRLLARRTTSPGAVADRLRVGLERTQRAQPLGRGAARVTAVLLMASVLAGGGSSRSAAPPAEIEVAAPARWDGYKVGTEANTTRFSDEWVVRARTGQSIAAAA